MANESLLISFQSPESISSVTSGRWIKLEQEYKSGDEQEAKFTDLYAMLAYVRSGHSAYEYLAENCPYATIDGSKVIVELDFYVWPSSIDLPYSLEAPVGTISDGVLEDIPKTFPIIVDGSDEEELPFLFDGTFTTEMPFISPDGSLLSDVTNTIDGNILSISQPVHTVYWADGTARGYVHTLTMELDKYDPEQDLDFSSTISVVSESGTYTNSSLTISYTDVTENSTWRFVFISSTNFKVYDQNGVYKSNGNINTDFSNSYFTLPSSGWGGTWENEDSMTLTITENSDINKSGYKIENLQSSIIASWINEDGETETETLDIEIPQCVQDMLADCGDGIGIKVIVNPNDPDENKKFVVYYNTCNGEVILDRWEDYD